MHFNESGSRMRHTLTWKGQMNVPIKECVGQTRDRWTLNTHVCSDPARFTDYPPLEAMFKGGPIVDKKVKHLLEHLCAGGDFGPMPWLSVTVGPKGSYRQEHVLRYLKRHLEPMTPTRRWRILMCDVYSAHLDKEVVA